MTKDLHMPTLAATIYREGWIAGLRGDPGTTGHRVLARREAWAMGWRDGQAVAAAGREFHRALAAASNTALGRSAGSAADPDADRLNECRGLERLEIEMAAAGCVSGTLAEWPLLDLALKWRGRDLPATTPASELRQICRELLP